MVRRPKVIWESKHIHNREKYWFDDRTNYLIYFKGCFCPPHRGHFNTVKRFLDLGDNIKVVINQMKSSRHGVPYNLKRRIWKTYISELLDSERVMLRSYNSFDDILDEDLSDIDTIISIRGIEDQTYRKVERKVKYNYIDICEQLSHYNIKLDFYYLERVTINKLSASEFTKTLINTRYMNKENKYERCKQFLPLYLDKRIAIKIIEELATMNLYIR